MRDSAHSHSEDICRLQARSSTKAGRLVSQSTSPIGFGRENLVALSDDAVLDLFECYSSTEKRYDGLSRRKARACYQSQTFSFGHELHNAEVSRALFAHQTCEWTITAELRSDIAIAVVALISHASIMTAFSTPGLASALAWSLSVHRHFAMLPG